MQLEISKPPKKKETQKNTKKITLKDSFSHRSKSVNFFVDLQISTPPNNNGLPQPHWTFHQHGWMIEAMGKAVSPMVSWVILRSRHGWFKGVFGDGEPSTPTY